MLKLKAQAESSHDPIHFAGLFIISLATLLFEINLTRLYSVSQYYHFAFLIIGFAMFGFGASGTCFSVFPHFCQHAPQLWLTVFTLGFSISCCCGYVLMNYLPFDAFSIAWDWHQGIILVLHCLVLSIPFFCCGAILNICFTLYTHSIGLVYAVNLIGSACGCLLAIGIPQWIGGDGIIWLCAVLGSAVTAVLCAQSVIKFKALLLLLTCLVGASAFSILLLKPEALSLRLSPYKGLSYINQYPDAETVSQRWNGYSRIDVVRSTALHSLPGLSYAYMGPLPPQSAVLIDGDNLSAILEVNDVDSSLLDFTDYLPGSIAYHLKADAHTLILEPRGGLEVWIALTLGSPTITVVESNPLIIASVSQLYQLPEVHIIPEDVRSAVTKCDGTFDIISIPLTSPYHPIRSGAYSLSEDYHQTIQAYMAYLKCLAPDGMMVITKWLQTPPSGSLRTFTTLITALEQLYLAPADRIVAFRGYNTMTFLIKKSPFTAQALQSIRSFTRERAFDMVIAPDIVPAEVNLYNVLLREVYYESFTSFQGATDRKAWYRTYPFNVKPTTDTHPFFGHYFKLSQTRQIIAELGSTWQPFGGAGFFVIIFFLGIALCGALAIIIIPVIFTPRQPAPTRTQTGYQLATFGLIGLGFLLIEVPLTQRFILYLGHPAYAMTAVLFSILTASGIGSTQAHRGNLRRSLLMVVLSGIVTLLCIEVVFKATLTFPLFARLGITAILLFPLGITMGLPFPQGIRAYGLIAPRSIAYAWSVNGATSVVASVLAAFLALTAGFRVVYSIGLCCYGLAWLTTFRAMPVMLPPHRQQ